MSQQNMPSRRQELLSRLKTTLAIVSQQTGFDTSERPAGESPHQWSSSRDPRLRRHETSNEGSAEAPELQPGGSKGSGTVPPTSGSSSTAPSSTLYHRKFDEIQDEDEFLYGSSVPEGSGQQHGGQGSSRQDRRVDDDPAVRLQWAGQKQVRPEESPRWTGSLEGRQSSSFEERQASSFEGRQPSSFEGRQPSSFESRQPSSFEERQASSFEGRQPGYGDRLPPQPTSQHASDTRRMGNTEPTQVGQTFDQSQPQWMQPTSQRGDSYSSWGGGAGAQQNLRYSDVGDQQQLTGRGTQMAAPLNVGELGASRLRDINAGMLEGILKLVATRTTAPPSQQPTPMPPQQQQQQQPVFESRQMYSGNSYPPQTVYSQLPDRQTYISPDVPGSGITYGQPMQNQQRSAYEYSQPAAQPHPQPSSDINPLLISQLSTALLAGKVAQPAPSQTVTGHVQRPMEQVGFGGQPTMLFPSVAAGSHFTGNQSVDRSTMQPNVAASTPSLPSAASVLEKSPALMPRQYPGAQDVVGTTASSQPDTAALKAEPVKEEGGPQRGGVDKDTLTRLLSMIGCGSNVTQLMQELIKKDEPKTTMTKEQSPAPQALEQPDITPATPSSVAPPSAPVAVEETKPQAMEDKDSKPITAVVPQMTPEPAHKPDSAISDKKEKASLLPDPPNESRAEEEVETIPTVPISSLSRLQKNYDSPDESAEKSSSPVGEDDEWKRSTDEFLSRIHKKSAAPAPKEKSRSKSKDKQKTKKTEAKKSTAKQSEAKAKKAKDNQAATGAGSEVSAAADVEAERAELLRGKREIEGALELLQNELMNLRTNKKRWLESPSSGQRDKELSNSIENERKLMDHMSQLKGAMAELNQHLEKLSPAKV